MARNAVMMKGILITILTLIYSICFAQQAEWVYVSSTEYTQATPALVDQDSTPIRIRQDFIAGVGNPSWISSDGKIQPESEDDLYNIRLGFSYRLPDTVGHVHFKVFVDVGPGANPLPITEIKESSHHEWVQQAPTTVVWAGNYIATNGGQVYVKLLSGSVELADVNVTISREFDNTVTTPTLVVERLPLYEYRDIWAEEGAGLTTNSAQYSFGNGAAGYVGLPIDDGWEVISAYFHSDGNGATDDVTVHLIDATTPSVNADIIVSITITDSGQGDANNAYQYDIIDPPVPVPNGAVLAFRTGTETGAFIDVRVGARLRRQVGEYVSNVTIQN